MPKTLKAFLGVAAFAMLASQFLYIPKTSAQDAVAITVTPPFFNLTMNPGDYWASAIKVVNTNPTPLTVHATPASFKPTSEEGYGEFIAVDKPGADEMAHWIELLSDSDTTIEPGQAGTIRFAIRAPKDASPGGHYGAVLIGQAAGNFAGNGMGVSSLVSSLLFVRVSGEAIEKGRVREFTISNTSPARATGRFTFRFENEGNVHLQPQGDIEIKNMWGQERGRILINQDSDFGNVLPNSVRKFTYDWTAKDAYFDIGRYTATLTLGYGTEGRQNATATIVFWVIPWDRLFVFIGSIAAIIVIFWLSIRAYVRKAVQLERGHYGPRQDGAPRPPAEIAFAPIRESAIDLRSLSAATPAHKKEIVSKYKPLFRYLAFLFAAALVLWFILHQLLETGRPYTAARVRPGATSSTLPQQ